MTFGYTFMFFCLFSKGNNFNDFFVFAFLLAKPFPFKEGFLKKQILSHKN